MMIKKKKSEPFPIRSSTQIKEDESKTIFTQLIGRWMVVSWIQRDFGIDANIEITKPIVRTNNQIVTGKRFSVQLKSSNSAKFNKDSFSLSIPKEKINYWMQSFEPVQLVYIDLKTKTAFYRWIDEDLIQELFKSNEDWIAQDSVSIRFSKSQTVDSISLNTMERYVLSWKRPVKTLLTPGNYFNFSNEAHQYALSLKELCINHKMQFLSQELDDLCEEVSTSIYTIAIIGLSRGGKSTLINALLHRDISPMGKLPTTGVPITIFPKNENKSYVTFKNSDHITGDASSEFLSEYTSQDKNPRNKKEVHFVRVHIVNTLLERGFALCDIPGLDDADPAIKNIAKTAVYNANAIIYVMSLASYNDGEFRINDQNISDLNELRGRMDRIFLVFNKVDKIRKDDLKHVKKYIDETLSYYNILNFLATPPLYISSLEAYERRIKNKDGVDSVSHLEQILWEYLINQNRTGLHKILSNFANNIELIDKLRNLASSRLQNTNHREEIEGEIKSVREEIGNLRSLISEKRDRIYNEINIYVINRFENVISHLFNELNSYNYQNLPTKEQITGFLENEAYKIISDVYEFLQQETFKLQSDVNQWVSLKLKQVEISLDEVSENQELKMPDISKYTGRVYSFFIENRGGYIGIVESLIVGIGNALELLFGKLFDAFTPNEKIREREINKTVRLSKKSYNQIQTDLLQNVSKFLTGICRTIEERINDRTSVYLGELHSLVVQLDTPLSNNEKINYQNFITKINNIEKEIISHYNHLKDYTDGIERIKGN